MNTNNPLQVLLGALRYNDPVCQAEAARLLGEARLLEAVPALLEYVEGTLQFHRSAGLTALGRIGDRSTSDRIFNLLDDPRIRDDWYWFGWKSVRAATAHALLLLEDLRGVPFLEQLAESGNDVFYSWYAAPILRLASSSPDVSRLKARITVDSLLTVPPNSTRLTDPGRLVPVIEALGLIGGAGAAESIRNYLVHPSRFVRGQAILSLSVSGHPAAECESFAMRMIQSDPAGFARARAAVVAGEWRVLADILDGAQDPFDRAVAVEGLGTLSLTEGIEAVRAALEDSDSLVRANALEALERSTDPALESLAERHLQDPSIRVRCQAAKALLVIRKGKLS